MPDLKRAAWLFTSCVLCALMMTACSSSARTVGASCSLNSECGTDLICFYGRCRTQCVQDVDCPEGASCLTSSSGVLACQLPTETYCTYDTDCGAGLHCNKNGEHPTCTTECVSNVDCPSGSCVAVSVSTPTGTSERNTCQVATAHNTECRTSNDCALRADGHTYCAPNGMCYLECKTERDCSGSFVCHATFDDSDNTAPLCVRNNRCGPACINDADCLTLLGTAASCDDGVCTPASFTRCDAPPRDAGRDAAQDASVDASIDASTDAFVVTPIDMSIDAPTLPADASSMDAMLLDGSSLPDAARDASRDASLTDANSSPEMSPVTFGASLDASSDGSRDASFDFGYGPDGPSVAMFDAAMDAERIESDASVVVAADMGTGVGESIPLSGVIRIAAYGDHVFAIAPKDVAGGDAQAVWMWGSTEMDALYPDTMGAPASPSSRAMPAARFVFSADTLLAGPLDTLRGWMMSRATVLDYFGRRTGHLVTGENFACIGLSDDVEMGRLHPEVYCWGNNDSYQRDSGPVDVQMPNVPTASTFFSSPNADETETILSMAAGRFHACVASLNYDATGLMRTGGGVHCWGNDVYNQTRPYDMPTSSVVVWPINHDREYETMFGISDAFAVPDDTNAIAGVYAGGVTSLHAHTPSAVEEATTTHLWGAPLVGGGVVSPPWLSAILEARHLAETDVPSGLYSRLRGISVAPFASDTAYRICAIVDMYVPGSLDVALWDQSIFCRGNPFASSGPTTAFELTRPNAGGGHDFLYWVADSVVGGESFVCALARVTGTDGDLQLPTCWGDNAQGVLGNSDGSTERTADDWAYIAGHFPEFSQLVAGREFACGVTTGRAADEFHSTSEFGPSLEPGQVWCWGRNHLGQLGRGEVFRSSDVAGPVYASP